MTTDLDALLTALYVYLDDHVLPSRAELVCVATAQVLLRCDGERRWLHTAPARNWTNVNKPCTCSTPSRWRRGRDRSRHLDLEEPARPGTPRSRTTEGLWARVCQRICALNAAIWHNWLIDAPIKRSLIAYDH
ncbi:hypothetical protein GCM10027440_07150 [Nocardiopsis coralliicola]